MFGNLLRKDTANIRRKGECPEGLPEGAYTKSASIKTC